MLNFKNLPGIVLLLTAISLLLSSCVTRKQITYFQKPDTSGRPLPMPYEPIIEPYDRVSILVTSVDKKATAFFTFSLNDNSTTAPSYLVNSNGIIDIPLVGPVSVGGLTTNQAKDTLKALIERYVNSPTVLVILKTFRVTVLGAVNAVGVVESDHEKMTLTEALSKCGDININGRRDNVLIIREKGSGKEYGRVDLRSDDVFSSPYFYLHANDIVYVEPGLRTRLAANQVYFGTISIIISFITLGLVYANIKK